MKLAFRTVRQILDVALVALVLVVLATVLAANVAPGLGHQLVVIRGGSMEPAIHLGSVVDLTSVSPTELKPGDVVTMKGDNGVLVTHRIGAINAAGPTPWVRLKGDANSAPDAPFPTSMIQGRVDGSAPYAGYLMYLLSTPGGIASVFLLAAAMLLSIWLLEDLEDEEEEERRLAPDAQPVQAGE